MKLKTLELKNYKSHKHYIANFVNNSVVRGNKGSGKTSLKDAFTWLITGRMVDDPTPVNSNGEIINHLTISVACELEDGTNLRIESTQRWVKDILKSRHNSTYFVNDTPMLEKDYQAYLDDKFGTLEQRKVLLDPSWFAFGDGLRVTGKTSKTAIQRRREIVIGVAGAENLEKDIADNEQKAKQAKFAISQLKKDLDDANAGIESLYESKIDVSTLDKTTIQNSIKELENEKNSTIKNLEQLNNEDNTQNALKQALNNAITELSNAKTYYTLDYNKRLEQARKPFDEYKNIQKNLEQKLEETRYQKMMADEKRQRLISTIDKYEIQRQQKLNEYQEVNNEVYIPSSTNCPTCQQTLPINQLREAEARFNKNRSDNLERILVSGKELKNQIDKLRKELELPTQDFDSIIKGIELELASLTEPIIELPTPFENTKEYVTLQKAVYDAQIALENNSSDSVIELYQRTLDNLQLQINELQNDLNKFATNNHLNLSIENKGIELQEIATKLDEQNEILDQCNEFTRKTLKALETTLEEKFEGIRFKMFEYTLDGEQKDTCITYAKTDVGYIPWESLSGGQKRSAIIKLANAFSKAWDIQLPLWIDDTQIYTEDELSANMQLIRITEVPHEKLEVR